MDVRSNCCTETPENEASAGEKRPRAEAEKRLANHPKQSAGHFGARVFRRLAVCGYVQSTHFKLVYLQAEATIELAKPRIRSNKVSARKNRSRFLAAAQNPIVNSFHLCCHFWPCKPVPHQFPPSFTYGAERRRRSAEHVPKCLRDALCAWLNAQRRSSGKTFRQVALRCHQDRFAIGPGLQHDHRQSLAERRQNKRVAFRITRRFVVAKLGA